MNAACRFARRAAGLAVAIGLLPAPLPSAERLLEGFEQPNTFQVSGKAALVKGADAVTEGASALDLSPLAGVTLDVPAQAVSAPGWLKVDTFEVQPVRPSVQVAFAGGPTLTANLSPGKDVLVVPLTLASRQERGAWPREPLKLTLRNIGAQSVVIDNVRLAEPEALPDGVVRLDFGPSDQALWPGFEGVETGGGGVTWSGNTRIYSFVRPFPDPLLGDIVGPYLSRQASEKLTIQGPDGGGRAWIWLTHHDYQFSPPMEYGARLNGKTVLQGRLTPAQMLSADGLLAGRDEPWTAEWFQKTFLPRDVARIESPINAGANLLELANCQVAAVIVAPRPAAEAARAYVERLESDLERYRRQFVLSAAERPRCTVAPTDEESRTGLGFFLPPPEERYDPLYDPPAEHRGKVVKMLAATGSTAFSALVVVPFADAQGLQVSMEALTDPGAGTIAPGNCQANLLESLPVVRAGMVCYQPFLPTRSLRPVRANGVYWVHLAVKVPDRLKAGTYRGSLRVTLGTTSTQFPVEVEVEALPPMPTGANPTFGVFTQADAYDAYRSLKFSLSQAQQLTVTRTVFSRLFSAGLNAGMIEGPTLDGNLAPQVQPMVQSLQTYPKPDAPGRTVVNLTGGMNVLRSGAIQPGTARYVNAVRAMSAAAAEGAAKAGLKDPVLYFAHVHPAGEFPEAVGVAQVVRAAGGRPAVATYASDLAQLDQAGRKDAFAALDALLCYPNDKDLGPAGDAFRKTGADKTFLVLTGRADPYACGFYCWGVGAHGLMINQVFASTPPFNPFWFDGTGLLVPTAAGTFDPTLSLLMFQEGMEDYLLAGRCQTLVAKAKDKALDASALEKVLTAIRVTADAQPPNFDVTHFRPGSVSPAQLEDWRRTLIREAAWLSQKMASP